MWQDDALEHAVEEDPRESCGLLIVKKGKEIYFPCQNLATQPTDQFILSPEDWIEAEDQGEIIGVVHSHPVTSPNPSEADKVACEKSNLKWWIIQPNLKKWGYCEPCGYKAPLIGRKWVWGVTDCWSLVKDWYKEEKNIELKDWDRPITPEEFVDNPLFESCAWRTGFRELRPNEKTMNGDALLMSIGSTGLNHVAIFLDGDVLHHLTDRLSCREPYSQWLLKCTGGRYRYVA